MREVVKHAKSEDQLKVARLIDPGPVQVENKRFTAAGPHRLDVLRATVRRGDVEPEIGEGIAEVA